MDKKFVQTPTKIIFAISCLLFASQIASAQSYDENTDWREVCYSGVMAAGFSSSPNAGTETEGEDIAASSDGCSLAISPPNPDNGNFSEIFEFYTPWHTFSDPVNSIRYMASFKTTVEDSFWDIGEENELFCFDVGLEYTTGGDDYDTWQIKYIGGYGLPEGPGFPGLIRPPLKNNVWHTPENGYGLSEIVNVPSGASRARFVFRIQRSKCRMVTPWAVNFDQILLDNLSIRALASPTPTRTPTITSTPTQTTTPRPLWDTPTPTPTGTYTPAPTKQFPSNYGKIPTRIPVIRFPSWNWAWLPPTPSSYFTIPLIDTPVIPTRAPFTFTIPISYNTPSIFNPPTVTATPTEVITGTPTVTPTATLTPTATATRADLVGDLNLLSTNLYSEAAVMQNPTTFTIQTAPVEYAPALPRPMANVGYTFEGMQGDIGFLYDPRAWASLLGYMASIPFQLVKFLYTLSQMMGPAGLFVTWLFILLPFVLFARMFLFIKNLIISIINLIVKFIQFIGDIWDLFPGL